MTQWYTCSQMISIRWDQIIQLATPQQDLILLLPPTELHELTDCTAAEPAVKEALSEAGTSAALVEAVVARAEYKGNADYPYRKDERIKLQAIPQLVRWEDGKSKESIVLETPDTDAVRALVLGE